MSLLVMKFILLFIEIKIMNPDSDSSIQMLSSTDRNKANQKRKILSILHSGGYISAPELSKQLKISLPTCIALLNDLLANGFIKNIGIGESSGGRKPNLYGLPENASGHHCRCKPAFQISGST